MNSVKALSDGNLHNSLSLSGLRFNGHLPGEPGSAGAYCVVTTGLLEL